MCSKANEGITKPRVFFSLKCLLKGVITSFESPNYTIFALVCLKWLYYAFFTFIRLLKCVVKPFERQSYAFLRYSITDFLCLAVPSMALLPFSLDF